PRSQGASPSTVRRAGSYERRVWLLLDMLYRKLSLSLLLFLLPGAVSAAFAAPVSSRPAPSPAASPRPPVVVFLGDSRAAGLGLPAADAYPAILSQRFAAQGKPIRVINAGVSGDTTAGGLRRLDWLLRQKPDVVVVGLGANDALRGADLAEV